MKKNDEKMKIKDGLNINVFGNMTIRKNRKLHNLNGFAAEYNKTWSESLQIREYWIDGKYYNNFISYIKKVIKYKKDNKII